MSAIKNYYISGFEFIIKPAFKQIYSYYYAHLDQVEKQFTSKEAFDLWDCGIENAGDYDEALEWSMQALFNELEDLYEMLCCFYECMPEYGKKYLEYMPIETAIKWMENLYPSYREEYRDFDLHLD